MTKKSSSSIAVLVKSSRRRFMKNSSGLLLAGATTALSSAALASDCDQAEQAKSSDQDAGESSDPKGCQQPKNVISQNLPERKRPINVKTIKT